MQVNNSGLATQANPIVQNQANTQQQSRVAEQLREQQNQQQTQRQQRVERLDVDENAIAELERDNQRRRSASENTSGNTSYDAPSQQNNTAISAYQSVGNIERRDNVQQLLGVDLFA